MDTTGQLSREEEKPYTYRATFTDGRTTITKKASKPLPSVTTTTARAERKHEAIAYHETDESWVIQVDAAIDHLLEGS